MSDAFASMDRYIVLWWRVRTTVVLVWQTHSIWLADGGSFHGVHP